MTRTLPLTAALLLTAVLTGCGGETGDSGAAKSVTTPAPTTPPASTAPSPSPSSTPEDGALPRGKTFSFEGGTMTTTVLQYKQPIGDAGPDLAKGEALGGVEVRTCNLAAATTAQQIGAAPWSLEWSDGTTTDSHWSGVVSAEYPYESKTIKPGRCVKGWIVFTVREKSKPALAVYEGQANQGRPAEWKLS